MVLVAEPCCAIRLCIAVGVGVAYFCVSTLFFTLLAAFAAAVASDYAFVLLLRQVNTGAVTVVNAARECLSTPARSTC